MNHTVDIVDWAYDSKRLICSCGWSRLVSGVIGSWHIDTIQLAVLEHKVAELLKAVD